MKLTAKEKRENQKRDSKIIKEANVIAQVIIDTNTDYRGNLFAEIAKGLSFGAQYYTGNLFQRLASEYGIKK